MDALYKIVAPARAPRLHHLGSTVRVTPGVSVFLTADQRIAWVTRAAPTTVHYLGTPEPMAVVSDNQRARFIALGETGAAYELPYLGSDTQYPQPSRLPVPRPAVYAVQDGRDEFYLTITGQVIGGRRASDLYYVGAIEGVEPMVDLTRGYALGVSGRLYRVSMMFGVPKAYPVTTDPVDYRATALGYNDDAISQTALLTRSAIDGDWFVMRQHYDALRAVPIGAEDQPLVELVDGQLDVAVPYGATDAVIMRTPVLLPGRTIDADYTVVFTTRELIIVARQTDGHVYRVTGTGIYYGTGPFNARSVELVV